MNDYGLSVRQLAHAAGVTERTARRWRRRGSIPEPYSTALIVRLGRSPALASSVWTGWSFHNDSLVSPEGVSYTTSDIRSSKLWQESTRQYRIEIARRRDDAAFARELQARATDLLTAMAQLIQSAERLRHYLPEPGRARPRPHVVKSTR